MQPTTHKRGSIESAASRRFRARLLSPRTLLTTLTLATATVAGLACSATQQDVEPTNGVRIAAATHMASAGMLERQNNLPAAMRQYEEVISNDPQMTAAYHGLGRVHFMLGRYDDAENTLSRGINVSKDVPALHNNLGFTYLQEKKYTEAESCFRRALELSPTFKRARMNLGVTLARQGRTTESIEQFSQVLPREDALFNVAVIRVEENNHASAAKMLREALFINPGYQPAYDHVDRIERIARTEAEAKAALSRLAARNAVASFGEPVASASLTRTPCCAVPDHGARDGVVIDEPSIKTVSLIDTSSKSKSRPAQPDPVKTAKAQPAEQAAEPAPSETSNDDAQDDSRAEAILTTEVSEEIEFVGPPFAWTNATPEQEATAAASIDPANWESTSRMDDCRDNSPTMPMSITSDEIDSEDDRPVIQPTFTNGVANAEENDAD